MGYFMNTNWQELKREFQQRRENAISAREKRRAVAYHKVPEIKNLDKQISLLGIGFSREALRQDMNSEELQSFEHRLEQLITKETAFWHRTVLLKTIWSLSFCVVIVIPALFWIQMANPALCPVTATASLW